MTDFNPGDLPDLYLIRHGQTDWNLHGRFQGDSDIALNDTGKAQAEVLSQTMFERVAAGHLATHELQIFASPLLRARQTAGIITQRLAHPVDDIVIEPGLKELSFGRWEGLTTLEVKKNFPDERRRRKADRWNFHPRNGESFAARVPSLLAFLESLHAPTVIVTHTGIIRLCLILLGARDREKALVEEISQDKIYLWSKGSLAAV
tara:strand:- start:66314 stop:66928 length:615 start_codon:yes stop_codon:yes gene_type:complete